MAPTVNLHRHPLGGRNFECYSEDPYLTAEMAVAFIRGVQSRGVACAVKHFVCNDQETDRMEIDVTVDERARRELYLAPFEAAVRQAGVWSIMAAYNRVDGLFCSEHPALLTGVLRDEWGFDGVVMSDWFGTHSTAVDAGLDLEMPGPPNHLGPHLVAALDAGTVTSAAVERAAQRVLRLIERTTPSRSGSASPVPTDAAAEFALAAATEAIVLLANDGVLPLDPTSRRRVAVIGWRADQPEFQGGGSAQVTPPYVITPLQAITDRVGPDLVAFEPGRTSPRSGPIAGRLLASGPTGAGEVTLEYFDPGGTSGVPLRTETPSETSAIWFGEPAPGVAPGEFSARMSAAFVPDVSGPWTLSVSALGRARLLLDGEVLADTQDTPTGAGIMGMFTVPIECEVELVAGETRSVVAEFDAFAADGPIALAGLTVEARRPVRPTAVDEAAAAAAAADVAIVVVGREERETEGQDSASMDLPDDQIELIRRVGAANPRTVVVVNTASPVTMDWADDVAAVVQMSYLGQETGHALAAVLFGDVDASGRLTTTHPRRIEDSPAHDNFPGSDGAVHYEEGIFVGYRHYDTHTVEPRWCFGHGLSYTTFEYSPLTVASTSSAAGEDLGDCVTVSLEVTNTGARRGSEVVQLYVAKPATARPQPAKELIGFEKVHLDPGETTTVTFELARRAFSSWDTSDGSWHVDPGEHRLMAGSSSRAIRSTAVMGWPGH